MKWIQNMPDKGLKIKGIILCRPEHFDMRATQYELRSPQVIHF